MPSITAGTTSETSINLVPISDNGKIEGIDGGPREHQPNTDIGASWVSLHISDSSRMVTVEIDSLDSIKS